MEKLTIIGLVQLIAKYLGVIQVNTGYGRDRGWLEEQDILQPYAPIERRAVARILHMILKIECLEKDEPNIDAAKQLKDLYDCGSCVNHVAQVYCKGIMGHLVRNEKIAVFGMRETMSVEEGSEAVDRVFQVSKRCSPIGKDLPHAEHSRQQAVHLSAQSAEEKMAAEQNYLLLDVRTKDEYNQKHLSGAVYHPFTEILENPEIIGITKNTHCYVYCENGYRSQIVADCLAQAGYEAVYDFALKK